VDRKGQAATQPLLSGSCQLEALFNAQWQQEPREMNALRFRPGAVFVAMLIILVCSITFLREDKHMHSLQSWPPGAVQPHRAFWG
jgi:hypothetical protein